MISVNKKPRLICALVLISRDSWVPAANRDTLDTCQFLEGSCLNFHTINYLIVSSVQICTALRELHICVRNSLYNIYLSAKNLLNGLKQKGDWRKSHSWKLVEYTRMIRLVNDTIHKQNWTLKCKKQLHSSSVWCLDSIRSKWLSTWVRQKKEFHR